MKLEDLPLENLAVNRVGNGEIVHIELARPEVANALNYAHLHDIETMDVDQNLLTQQQKP